MSLTRMIVKKFVPFPKIEEFTTFLFVGPHADDIEIGAGATVAKLTAMKKKVVFLICTDGRYGDGLSGGLKGKALSEKRREEALASAALLGVTDVRFLDLEDGGNYEKKDLIEGIAGVIKDVEPDIIFAPDPDVKSEAHVDHLRTGKAVKMLTCLAPYPGIMKRFLKGQEKGIPVQAAAFYMTASPNRYVKTGNLIKKQFEALDCHVSQYPSDSDASKQVKLYLRVRSLDFGLRTFSPAAEGFRVLSRVHMHCLPEASPIR